MASISDPWSANDPPSEITGAGVPQIDPRVDQTHVIGQTPCPPNPPPPIGWKYWNHSVRASLVDLATRMLHDSTDYPMGSFVQAWLDGELVAARVEWHDFQGATGKRGCFRGVNLMQRDATV